MPLKRTQSALMTPSRVWIEDDATRVEEGFMPHIAARETFMDETTTKPIESLLDTAGFNEN